MSSQKRLVILLWNAAHFEEKGIEHIETEQAVLALLQVNKLVRAFSCVHCAREN